MIRSFFGREHGRGSAEVAVAVIIVAVVIMGILTIVGTRKE